MRSGDETRARDGSRLALPALTDRAVVALLALAVLVGLVFRLTQYLADRALWLDESLLALNIVGRGFGELIGHLSFDQAAPTAFLLVEKTATVLFGSSEFALRLVPLLCGLASVPLFAILARSLLRPVASVVATLLFAAAAGPVYYASEVKQYSGDLAAALILLLLAPSLLRPRLTHRRALGVAAGGAVAILTSHPSVFVAGGVSLVVALAWIVRRERPDPWVAAAVASWLCASGVIIGLGLRGAAHLETLAGGGSGIYVHPLASGERLEWLRSLVGSFNRLLGFSSAAALRPVFWGIVILALAGLVTLAIRRPLQAGYLAGPFALMTIASIAHKYPIFDRTLLFLVPVAAILVAEGAASLPALISHRGIRRGVAAVLAAGVLLLPTIKAVQHLVHPRGREEIRTALKHLRSQWRPGDTLYVSYQTQFAMRYYLECGCFAPAEVTGDRLGWRFEEPPLDNSLGVALRTRRPFFVVGGKIGSDYAKYARDLERLKRPRVWLLYSHVTTVPERSYLEHALRARLDRRGRLLDAFSAPGTILYLYDLRGR
jgi:hypothetical protein